MRLCSYFNKAKVFRFPFYYICKIILRHYKYKYGISVSYAASIGPGFYIGHFGGIFINKRTVIGKNCNISHDVTIGIKNRGDYQGTPSIGDNVYIGPGAKIIGSVIVGNNVSIGANCVVTKDIADNSVVIGVPGREISENGSHCYINFTDYKPYDILD